MNNIDVINTAIEIGSVVEFLAVAWAIVRIVQAICDCINRLEQIRSQK